MALNHISIMGRIVNDLELKTTPNGVDVISFAIACDRDYTNGDKHTDFIDCVAWRGTAQFISKYFAKGRMIIIAGKLQTRPWTDKDGNKRKAVEIVADNAYFGDSKKAEDNTSFADTYTSLGTTKLEEVSEEYNDSDLPF